MTVLWVLKVSPKPVSRDRNFLVLSIPPLFHENTVAIPAEFFLMLEVTILSSRGALSGEIFYETDLGGKCHSLENTHECV